MSRPVVHRVSEYVYSLLPDYVRDADVATDYTLLKWLSGGVDQAATVVDIIDATDPDTSPSGLCELTSPALAPRAFLPWLAGLLGLNSDDYPTAQVRTALSQVSVLNQRGSVAAITARVQTFLTGAKSVTVTPYYSGSVWQILVQSFTAETPDPTAAGLAAEAEAPAGVRVTYQSLAGITYAALDAKYTDYANMSASGLTYGQLTALQS